MERTITVKGVGQLSLKPDLTIVTIMLNSLDKVYEKAMADEGKKLEALEQALAGLGFAKEDLKTTDFNVYVQEESIRDKNGNYQSVFAGYNCHQGLKLAFDFDTKRLSKVLAAISHCIAEPRLNIQFSVKDKAAVNEKLLAAAAVNAREKAQVLAKASGVTLGELLNIDYNWGELNLYSRTNFSMDRKCMAMAAPVADGIEMTPDDIEVSDSVAFTWAIR